jgi:hypothetical protein
MNKIVILTVFVIGGFIIAGNWYISAHTQPQEFRVIQDNNKDGNINNYNDCVAAGYPVMESLPEQCATDDGRVFTNTNAQLPATNGIAVGEPYGESAPQSGDTPAAIEAVQAQAAEDVASNSEEIKVISVSPEEWPDSCLGLPDADEMCAMMITSGYEIIVSAQGKTLTYRTNQTGTVVKGPLY